MENKIGIELLAKAEKEMSRSFSKTQMEIFFKGVEYGMQLAQEKKEEENA